MKMADIAEELSDLEDKVAEIPDHIKIKRMQVLRKMLDDLVAGKTKAIMFRSKAKWYQLGEKRHKLFFIP